MHRVIIETSAFLEPTYVNFDFSRNNFSRIRKLNRLLSHIFGENIHKCLISHKLFNRKYLTSRFDQLIDVINKSKSIHLFTNEKLFDLHIFSPIGRLYNFSPMTDLFAYGNKK